MPLRNRILDNQAATVADHLRHNLRSADAFDLASAYFTIYGYQLLADELDKVGRCPVPVWRSYVGRGPRPNPPAQPSRSSLPNEDWNPTHTATEALAKRCADWIAKDTIKVRSISRAQLPARQNVPHSFDRTAPPEWSAVQTSPKRGLGGSDRPTWRST